jgi:iron complex outermembrane receptor protein
MISTFIWRPSRNSQSCQPEDRSINIPNMMPCLLGFEFSLEYELVTDLQFRTATEYVWNKNLETSLPLPFTPPFSVFGELEYGKSITGSTASYYFVSANYHFYADQNRVDRNELPTAGYSLVSLSAGFDFKIKNQNAQFRLSVNNVFDKAYMNHLSRYRLLNLPEQGRNVIVSLRLPFRLK